MLSLEALVQPVDPQEPSGPNLEYDPDFLALFQLARVKPEQQFGNTLIAAQEPNWVEIVRAAQELLARTKDLRVAVLWLRAATLTQGYEGFIAGVKLLESLVVGFWDSVHPRLDSEDDNDATMRLNALAALNDASTVLRDVRQAAIGARRGADALRLRDIELALGKAQPAPGEPLPTLGAVQAALQMLLNDDPGLAARLAGVAGSLAAIESAVEEKTRAHAGVNMEALRKLTGMVAQLLPRNAQAAQDAAGPADAAHAAANPAAANDAAQASGQAGLVRSREDALRALDQVCLWLLQSEPTNPAPLVIQRARRLMTMNFLDIVRDMAPSALDQVMGLVGPDERSG